MALHNFSVQRFGRRASSSDAVPIRHSGADVHFLHYFFEHTGASGDNRGMYLRLQLAGGGGGEAGRIFTRVDANGTGTAHGGHISLGFGSSAGNITGLGVASRNTLHLPNRALGGTCAATQSEIWAEGASSDAGAVTALHRYILDGNATGRATVLNLLSVVNAPDGTGKMVETSVQDFTVNTKIRCLINGTPTYIAAVQ